MTHTGVAPGISGTTLYLHLNGDLDAALARTRDAGARILVEVTALPDPTCDYDLPSTIGHWTDQSGRRGTEILLPPPGHRRQ